MPELCFALFVKLNSYALVFSLLEIYHFSWKIHVWGITLPIPTPICTSPVPLGATADIADRRSPSPSAECPENHTESPRREVVRSSAGASGVYPPFLGSFA